MRIIALERGGKCLSDVYTNSTTKLHWRCKEGHEWETIPKHITLGKWCPECAKKNRGDKHRKYIIEDMRALAYEHGGTCLSEIFISVKAKLHWQCKLGHEWEATPDNIKHGKWCPECAKKNQGDAHRKYTIEDMRKLAQQRGGECLSDIFTSVAEKLHWRCAKKHRWKTTPVTIMEGSWCPQCSWQELAGQMPDMANRKEYHSFEKAEASAHARGGKCIRPEHWETIAEVTRKLRLEWECAQGHRWKGTYGNVVKKQTWCPVCARKSNTDANRKYTIEDMQVLAQKRGGKCLSSEFVAVGKKLLWKCNQGHEWKAIVSSIQEGTWCPDCAKKKTGDSNRKYTIEDIRALATERDGRCLSQRFINIHQKLHFQCKEGHEWEAISSSILQGSWCPKCGNRKSGNANRKYSIEDMMTLAEKRGGKCLSELFMGVQTPLRWCCNEGHEWETKPSNILQGTWCPQCARKNNTNILRKYNAAIE